LDTADNFCGAFNDLHQPQQALSKLTLDRSVTSFLSHDHLYRYT